MAFFYVDLDALLTFQQNLAAAIPALEQQLYCKDELIEKTKKALAEATIRAAAGERIAQKAYLVAQDNLRAAEQRTREYNNHLAENQSPISTPDYYYEDVDNRESELHVAESFRKMTEATLSEFERYATNYHRKQEEAFSYFKSLLSKSADFFVKYVDKMVVAKKITALSSGGTATPKAEIVQPQQLSQSTGVDGCDTLSNALSGYPLIVGSHTIADDLAATNPNYSYVDPDSPWNNNCQRCVSVYEARRRGFNVQAKPAPGFGDPLPIMRHPKGWPTVYEGYNLVDCSANSGTAAGINVEQLTESWGENARAIVRIRWKYGGGHVFIAERINGVTHFVDPQNGDPDVYSYFQCAKGKDVYCMRIDNLAFSEGIRQCCSPS